MTELEEKQRRNRFYFFVLFWIISVLIALYAGYSFGLGTPISDSPIFTTHRVSFLTQGIV